MGYGGFGKQTPKGRKGDKGVGRGKGEKQGRKWRIAKSSEPGKLHDGVGHSGGILYSDQSFQKNMTIKGRWLSKGHFDVPEADAVKVLYTSHFVVSSGSGVGPSIEELVESVEAISSYNWDAIASKSGPMMRIPGLPKVYMPVTWRIGQLAADTENFIAYENHLRLPGDPLAPIIQAVRVACPQFDFASVDVLCHSNDLRKLIGFLQGDCSATSGLNAHGMRDRSFKVCVDAMNPGGGVYLTRCEQHDVLPASWLPPNIFAKAFEKKVTVCLGHTEEMYHRIVRVKLGSLVVLNCAEVDACDFHGEQATHYLNESVSKLALGCKVKYIVQGGLIDSKVGTMVEIKTKSHRNKKIDWASYMWQMIFSGSWKIVIGFHTKGLFSKPVEFTFEQILAKVDKDALQRTLCQLEMLLREIITTSRQVGGSLDMFCAGCENKPLIFKKRDSCEG